MASTTNKLQDPNLSEQEQDAIIGAFVRRHENERLRERWEHKLDAEHGVSKQLPVKKRNATIRKIGITLLAVAASLLMIFVIIPQLNQPTGNELLASYISEMSIDNSRGATQTDAETLRQQVANAFNDGNYTDAVSAAESLAKLAEADQEDALNLGKAYLSNGDFPSAERVLGRLLSQPNDYTTEARYILGLSLLSQEKTAEAVEELKKINSRDGVKIYQKARALIEKFE